MIYIHTGPGPGSETPEAFFDILPGGSIQAAPERLEMERFVQKIRELQTHPGFGLYLQSLPEHTRLVVERVLESGVTPSLIHFADDCPDEEWKTQHILHVIVGGNIYMLYSVTDIVLGEIELAILEPRF